MNRRLLITAALSAGAGLFAAPDPFAGVWKLNPAKSKLPIPDPQSQIAYIEVDATGIRIREEVISDKGEHLTIRVDAKFDGKDYPITGTPYADSGAYRRVDRRTIQATSKKAGQIVETETAVVSPEGKLMKVTYSYTGAGGKPSIGVAVLEKQ